MERKKVIAVIPSEREGSRKKMERAASAVLAREILHFVQDDRMYGGAMHGLVLK